MAGRYVFDSSAVLAIVRGEAGAEFAAVVETGMGDEVKADGALYVR